MDDDHAAPANFSSVAPTSSQASTTQTQNPASSVGKIPGQVIGTSLKPALVCFSHLRWDFVWQRPQHLLTRAARDFDVIFIEEPVFEVGAKPHLSVSPRLDGISVMVPRLPMGLDPTDVVAAQQLLIAECLDGLGRRRRVFWYYTPMAMAFSAHFQRDVTVYDNMDELSAFRGASPELLSLERDLLASADVVFTGGLSLYEAKRGRHANIHAFPSSIETAHFGAARRLRSERPLKSGTAGPRLGFFGVIDERLDIELLSQLAALRPGWQIDMIGPVVKIDRSSLPVRPNIAWRGSCDYAELPGLLADWDVGLMPFAINEATRYISPTKTPEFLAAGVPVVSTPITDVVKTYGRSGLVAIASTAAEFVVAIEELLVRPKAPWLDMVDRQLAAGSWDSTWDAMRTLIGTVETGEGAGLGVAPESEPGVTKSVWRQKHV